MCALVFVGFMGAGKSTAARHAAARLGGQALHSDELLEQRLGHSIAQEFEQHGEAAFRAAEETLVCELLERAAERDVLALGGGSVGSERVRAALAAHTTVLLDVDAETAWRRVGGDGPDARARPLARDRAAFLALHAERQPLYERLADAFLAVGDATADATRSVVQAALPALLKLAQAPSGTRLLWATSASGDYPVLFGRDLLGADIWPIDRPPSKRYCISDETVAALYGERVGPLDGTIVFPPGEHHKTLATAERIWQELAQQGATRADHLVALGGGVVGDLAGFCAATYQRGVPVIQLPTTLVAQVDSAYGGKTGVDVPEAKNYVGAYHQPAGVIVDPATLDTLPPAEHAAGYVEVIKTALIAGGELWRRVADDEPVDERTILACARTKLAIVARDERDAGARQALNLGHTVGHAIETATGYARYRHGEAVGLGLLAALRLSGQPELRSRVAGLLAAHGLPTRLGHASVEAVVAATARDKKRTGHSVPFVLVDAPGAVRTGCAVSQDALSESVAELAA